MVDKMSDEEFGEKMYEEFGDDLGGDVEGYRKAAAADVQTVGDEMRKQKLEQMEMRSKKAVELLQDHPLVEYANRNEKYYDVWCGLSTSSTEAVVGIASEFGLVEPKVEVKRDNSDVVMDVWWEVRDVYMKEWRWRDVDEWIENYEYSESGVPLSEVVDE